MRQRHRQPDRAVPAHPEEPDVVKKDHPGRTRRIVRGAKQRAHHRIVAPRLIHHRGPEMVETLAKHSQPFGQRTRAQIRAAFNHDPRRLAAGMRIDHVHAPDRHSPCYCLMQL